MDLLSVVMACVSRGRGFQVLTVSAAVLAGCAGGGVQVERTAFLPAGSNGAHFVMLPAKDQDNDPVYVHDAQLVSAQLAQRGFIPVADAAQARFAVMVRERHTTPARRSGGGASPFHDRSGATSGQMGGASSFGGMHGIGGLSDMGGVGSLNGGGMVSPLGMSSGMGMGRGGGVGMENRSSTGGDYREPNPEIFVSITMFDLTKPEGTGQRVLSARAHTDELMPRGVDPATALIAAVFQRFPGPEHDTYSVPLSR